MAGGKWARCAVCHKATYYCARYGCGNQRPSKRVATKSEPVTPIVFRVLEGEVIALFPFEPASMIDDGWTCTSYMHVGQHGAADPRLVQRTRLATAREYASLLAELTSEPYNYRVQALRRFPRNAYNVRRAKIRRICAKSKEQQNGGCDGTNEKYAQ